MEQLTEEQSTLIVNSEWIINTIIKRLKQQGNGDLKQDLWLYMCSLVQRYDPTYGVKWDTYAYGSLELYARRRIKQEQRRAENTLPLQDAQLENVVDTTAPTTDTISATAQIKALAQLLTTDERKVLVLKLKDYSLRQVAQRLGYPLRKIDKLWHSIKDKAKANAPPP